MSDTTLKGIYDSFDHHSLKVEYFEFSGKCGDNEFRSTFQYDDFVIFIVQERWIVLNLGAVNCLYIIECVEWLVRVRSQIFWIFVKHFDLSFLLISKDVALICQSSFECLSIRLTVPGYSIWNLNLQFFLDRIDDLLWLKIFVEVA